MRRRRSRIIIPVVLTVRGLVDEPSDTCVEEMEMFEQFNARSKDVIREHGWGDAAYEAGWRMVDDGRGLCMMREEELRRMGYS